MAFNGSEGSTITYAQAGDLCSNYQTNHPTEKKGFYIGRDLIEDILAQDECVGIRVYKGEDDDGNENFIWVGVDRFENDMVDGVIADYCFPCPNTCGSPNNLNNI